jgi:hypothetical protein
MATFLGDFSGSTSSPKVISMGVASSMQWAAMVTILGWTSVAVQPASARAEMLAR